MAIKSTIFKASLQVDLFDPDYKDAWKQGFYMRIPDKKVLMKSDYLRKEAEYCQFWALPKVKKLLVEKINLLVFGETWLLEKSTC